MPKENMEEKGYINIKFVIFLKTTLGKMVSTDILGKDLIDLHFWQTWPKKFYNVKCYDNAKNDLKASKAADYKDNERDKEEEEERQNVDDCEDPPPDPELRTQQAQNSGSQEINVPFTSVLNEKVII